MYRQLVRGAAAKLPSDGKHSVEGLAETPGEIFNAAIRQTGRDRIQLGGAKEPERASVTRETARSRGGKQRLRRPPILHNAPAHIAAIIARRAAFDGRSKNVMHIVKALDNLHVGEIQ